MNIFARGLLKKVGEIREVLHFQNGIEHKILITLRIAF